MLFSDNSITGNLFKVILIIPFQISKKSWVNIKVLMIPFYEKIDNFLLLLEARVHLKALQR